VAQRAYEKPFEYCAVIDPETGDVVMVRRKEREAYHKICGHYPGITPAQFTKRERKVYATMIATVRDG
jgi:hypothetical protein